MHKYIYASNWKMQFSFNQALAYAQSNKKHFIQLAQQKNTEIIVCPSFDALAPITQLFKASNVYVGAQIAQRTKRAHIPERFAHNLSENAAHTIALLAIANADSTLAKLMRLLHKKWSYYSRIMLYQSYVLAKPGKSIQIKKRIIFCKNSYSLFLIQLKTKKYISLMNHCGQSALALQQSQTTCKIFLLGCKHTAQKYFAAMDINYYMVAVLTTIMLKILKKLHA